MHAIHSCPSALVIDFVRTSIKSDEEHEVTSRSASRKSMMLIAQVRDQDLRNF